MATQMTQNTITLNNGTVGLAFAYLNDRAGRNSLDCGYYAASLIIEKGSKDERDFRQQYEVIRQEALATYGVQVPLVEAVMKDGDRKNADLASNGRDTVNSYNNAYYVKLKSAYPIRLYNKEGLECKARANNGAYVKDAQGCDAYYLPGIEHSKINVQLRFNVGISTQGRPFAKPYPNWIQQCVEGTSTGSFTGPAAWTGSAAQTQPQPTAYNPQTAPMPTQVQPHAQAYQRPVVPTTQVQQYAPQPQVAPQPMAQAQAVAPAYQVPQAPVTQIAPPVPDEYFGDDSLPFAL